MTAQVIHLIDEAGPLAHPAGLAMVRGAMAQTPETDHRLILLGGQRLARDAAAAGLEPGERRGVPAGRAWRGLPTLARALRGRSPAVIHCWSISAFCAARLLQPRTPLVLTLSHRPTARGLGILRWTLRMRGDAAPVRVASPSPTIAGALLAAGLDPRQVTGLAPINPQASPPPLDRSSLRRRWAAPGGREPDAVLALLSEPPAAGDAAWGVVALGLAHESLNSPPPEACPRRRLKMLVDPRARRRPRAEYNLKQLAQAGLMTQEPAIDRPWAVLPGCDAALMLGEAPTLWPWAIDAKVPIIAEDRPLNREWAQHEDTALLVTPGPVKQPAHAIERLLTEPGLAEHLTRHRRRDFTPLPVGDLPSPTLAELYAEVQQVKEKPAYAPG